MDISFGTRFGIMRQCKIKLAMNTAKCPKCEAVVANIHYEVHRPNSLSGFRGSQSFTAVAYPCGHILGAVPITWEMRLEEIDKTISTINQKINALYLKLEELSEIIQKVDPKSR